MAASANRSTISRRQMLKTGAAALAGAHVLRTRPTSAQQLGEKLRVAAVGVGNKGWDDLTEVASAPGVRVVALCDVDSNYLDRAAAKFADAQKFADYRQMLDESASGIDAVIVATPDHMHGPVSLAAMSLGKHVYVEKPLAHNLAELRRMQRLAAEDKLVTQMGTQIHAHSAYRTAARLLQEGAIGKPSAAHSWISGALATPAKPPAGQAAAPPASLDWNLWQGVAPERPFAEGLYHPGAWRVWRDYGCGMLGDMACHLFDPLFSGLELRPAIAVRSGGPENPAETFAPTADVLLTFAGTPRTAETFTIRWTHGGVRSQAESAHLPAGVALPANGSLVVGDNGVMVLPHWAMPTLYRGGVEAPLPIEPEPSGNHYHEWAAACRGDGRTSTPFEYGCVVTESVLVGSVAANFPQQTLRWNSQSLAFDSADATELIRRKYREGWQPAGV